MKFYILMVCALHVVHGLVGCDKEINDMANELLAGFGMTTNNLLPDAGSKFNVTKEVTFWCTRRGSKVAKTFKGDPEIKQKIDLTKPVAFVIHGWTGNVNLTWVQNILQTYPQHLDENVCGVDWHRLANFEYSTTAGIYTYAVAEVIADFIRHLNTLGVSNYMITLIGHSLGGQISGLVGGLHHGSIAKIYALDPAGPFFCFPVALPPSERLDPSDAQYVQVILTSRGLFGCDTVCGHHTFYPNGGADPQPGCDFVESRNILPSDTLSCSHGKAHEYFLWSLFPENKLTALGCSDWFSYLVGECNDNPTDVLGVYHARYAGFYFLETGLRPPSGKFPAASCDRPTMWAAMNRHAYNMVLQTTRKEIQQCKRFMRGLVEEIGNVTESFYVEVGQV